ncbi:signal transduction histidine kinase/ligand-binding sensor domain-containing protein [Silvibacterium bohemicum]|uniref:Signal transduction histidine kinase/ligand-binding sensor domain-containing protein n=1 Tax=Silvibacterium bohemicum TaxID=1577686 RepID=A0A841K3S7_9BACT|nr:sensor histidine kinase [Silvibacterium bohemicum]MBB6145288.1 signal transduction histidine kinase/ligand-binding sensor domain-containing protein [Silvibacterium bohemicum]
MFAGSPNAITQTTDGYLWIGTDAGLMRFDGVRFVPWAPANGQHLFPSSSIYSLLGGSDGSLWIGTGSNLARLKDGNLTNYANGLGRIDSIIEDHRHAIWIARTRSRDEGGPICEVTGPRLHCYGKADGVPIPYSNPLVEDGGGNLWIGAAEGAASWRPGSSTLYVPKGLKTAKGLSGVTSLATGADGSMWVGIDRHGRGVGLQQLIHGRWKPFVTPELDSSTLSVMSLLRDRENALWVATLNNGIYRLHNGKVDRFGAVDGLSGNTVSGFYEDREGNMWVATPEGIDCFRNLRVVSFSPREGLTDYSVESVLATREGDVWIGNFGGLDLLRNNHLSSIRQRQGLPGVRVTSLLEDRAGRLWLGVDDKLEVYEDHAFHPIKRSDGSQMGAVFAMAEDRDGSIWVEGLTRPTQLLRIRDRQVSEEFTLPPGVGAGALAPDPEGGFWLGITGGDLARYWNGRLEIFRSGASANSAVRQVSVEPDGTVLAATSVGLLMWKDGKFHTLTASNGLPCEGVFSFVLDSHGTLWLYTRCGVVEIAAVEFERWRKTPDARVNARLYDFQDGARPAMASFHPRASLTPDGRLWFATSVVVQMVDPNNLALNTIVPPVHVEEMIADRTSYPVQQGLRLPPRTRQIEIDYTALSFDAPKKVRFRYRLIGYDTDWQEPGARRQAFYSDLRPGKYRFHVIACNSDGLWNDVGADLNFVVLPAWYQTRCFLLLSIAAGICAVWIFYRLRVEQIARAIGVRFDERLAERTRIARDLHDTFLQTVQGSKLVADDALDESSDLARTRRALGQLSVWLEQATQESRAALNSLRTSTTERNDLAEAFRRALDDCRTLKSIAVTFSSPTPAKEMHPIVRDEVYRIGYEAIRNACKHSEASQLTVELSYSQDFSVRIHDNGIGIDPAVASVGKEGHFGLQGMRERASRIGGKLTIVSAPNSGTEVTLTVPGRIVFRRAHRSL